LGMTSNRSSATHHTMMSSTTDASSGSSRCVYWVRPGPILDRSLVSVACSRSNASDPVTRTVPRWLTSNTAASVRQARCSARVPVGYWIGISHPPNGAILAPRARWRLSSGDVCRLTGAEASAGAPWRSVPPPTVCGATPEVSAAALGRRSPGGAAGLAVVRVVGALLRGKELDDGGVALALHAVEGQQVEHALALVAVHHVDELVVLPDEHGAVADHDELGRRQVLVQLLAQVGEGLPDGLELDPVVEQGLDQLQLEQVAVAVSAARAAAAGVGHRRADEVGARPVVELPVADADDVGRLLAADRLDRAAGLAHGGLLGRRDTGGITPVSRSGRLQPHAAPGQRPAAFHAVRWRSPRGSRGR